MARVRILEDLRFAGLIQDPSVDLSIDDLIIEGEFFVSNSRTEDTISIKARTAYLRGFAETLADRIRALPNPLYHGSLLGDRQVQRSQRAPLFISFGVTKLYVKCNLRLKCCQ